LPDSFAPFGGLVWLAVLVTLGSRSIVAALIAGVVAFVMPGVFASYVSTTLGDVPTILFGLGAVGLATHPEGAIAQTANNIAGLFNRRRRSEPPTSTDPGAGPSDQMTPSAPRDQAWTPAGKQA
jgi:branched-chain amino acid transport system permease protein